jgi:hypothetical protein
LSVFLDYSCSNSTCNLPFSFIFLFSGKTNLTKKRRTFPVSIDTIFKKGIVRITLF